MGNISSSNGASAATAKLRGAFYDFAKLARESERKMFDLKKQIQILAEKSDGPFRNIRGLFDQYTKNSTGTTKEEYKALMMDVCMASIDWFPAYIIGEDIPEQQKMDIINRFTVNFKKISTKFMHSLKKEFKIVDKDKTGRITWSEFAPEFFGRALKTVKGVLSGFMKAKLKKDMEAEFLHTNTLRSNLLGLFESLSKNNEDTVSKENLITAIEKKILEENSPKDDPHHEIRKILGMAIHHLRSKHSKESKLTKTQFLEKYQRDWNGLVALAENLALYPRGSYCELYSKRCRWKLAVVKRYFTDGAKVWLTASYLSGGKNVNVDVTDSSQIRKISWHKDMPCEIKDSNNFCLGVVVVSTIVEDRRKTTEWVGIRYNVYNENKRTVETKKVKVESSYCPRLFRPLSDGKGVQFGYTVTLSCVFFDVEIGSFRYILEIKGPESTWRIGKNFTLMRNFFAPIKKYVYQNFEGIEFPPGRIFGAKELSFIKEREQDLSRFWRRLSRKLHLMEEGVLEKITKFLKIPFVSQKQADLAIKPTTFIKLERLENLPAILDDQGRPRQTCAYVRMSMVDSKSAPLDEVEWITKVDCLNPAWYGTRPILSQGHSLQIEVWQDNQGKSPDTMIADRRMETKNLEKGESIPIPLELSSKVIASKEGGCRVYIRLMEAPPKKKYLYLVRHGQSKWNAAKRELDLVTAFGIIDHGLTPLGAEQAEELAKK